MKNNKYLFILIFLSINIFAQDSLFENGKKIYYKTCLSCHGVDGSSNPEMKLIVFPRKLNKTILSEEQMYKITRDGGLRWGARSDIMPGFKYVLSDKDIKSVSHYISKFFNPNRDEKIAKLLNESDIINLAQERDMIDIGKEIYSKRCGLCHGTKGDAKSEYIEKSKSSKDFIYPYNLRKILLDENQIFLYAKYGGHFWGTAKDDMQAWNNKYNDFKLYSVAKYINQEIKQQQKD